MGGGCLSGVAAGERVSCGEKVRTPEQSHDASSRRGSPVGDRRLCDRGHTVGGGEALVFLLRATRPCRPPEGGSRGRAAVWGGAGVVLGRVGAPGMAKG